MNQMSNGKYSPIQYQADTDKVNILKDAAQYRADRDVSLSHFKELLDIFNKSADPETGLLHRAQFKKSFKRVLGQGLTDDQLELLFMKIDVDTDDLINWDDLSTYMLLRAQRKKLMKEAAEMKIFESDSSKRKHCINTMHKEMIVKVQHIPDSKRYMTCCREGTICYWNESFKLQRYYKNAGQLKQDSHGDGHVDTGTIFQGTKYRWIHDAVYMSSLQKIALASDDHQITFYESSTLEKCFCLDLQSVNALSLDFHIVKNSTENMLLFSTDAGTANVFYFNEDKMAQIAVKHKGLVQHIILEKDGSIPKNLKELGSIWKRKAHKDWATKVKYYSELKFIVSCSPDPVESMVVAELDNNHKWQFHTCSVNKGVNTFAFCAFPISLFTGGTDRKVRIWNPHRLNSPVATLKGHVAPIVDLCTNQINGQVISLSCDKMIKVWDIRNQICLQTILNFTFQKPDDTFSSVLFLSDSNGESIITTSNAICRSKLIVQKQVQNNPKSHSCPITGVLYNSIFDQIITGCHEGVINVWDGKTGQKTFTITDAHGSEEVTCLTFDALGRRLITGGRDGSVRIWNYNNGEMLQELMKDEKTEVTAICYIPVKELTYIAITGWDQKVTIYIENPKVSTLYPSHEWPAPNLASEWHNEDILSMVFCPPIYLATSSYNGTIIVCNLQSGNIIHTFRPHLLAHDLMADKKSIDKLIAFQVEANGRNRPILVSAGGDGIVRFWCLYEGEIVCEIDCSNNQTEGVFALTANKNASTLYVGCSNGLVYVYDINDILADMSNAKAITAIAAHASLITSIELIEEEEVILTSSVDCTVRLFKVRLINKYNGDFIGVLGQNNLWNIADVQTFCHPAIPWDITLNQRTIQTAIKREASRIPESPNLAPQTNGVVPPTEEEPKGSWYSNSYFVQSHFGLKQKRTRSPLSRPAYNSSGVLRVYHSLLPKELGEIQNPSHYVNKFA